ncbi:MAG: type I restriction endonuclease subunit R [Bacteroidales bacterium]|nr:type I restriction endonuclease subunit R [Bacteroidales bacterium]
MAQLIYEDDIEQAVMKRLALPEFGYEMLFCDPDPSKREDLNDGTGRSSKKECVLPVVLKASLRRINPQIPESIIDDVVRKMRRDYSGTDMVATNYELYGKIRNGIKVNLRRNGKDDFDFVRLVDFDNPGNNTFTAVSQMWIQGKVYARRPDVLIFINGLPMVFIELKNSVVKVEEAYNKNLQDYRRDIPNLFAFNQICVLSNGLETKLGAFNASYDFFFDWLKVDSEKEKPQRGEIRESGLSIVYFINGLLKKERLLDYIENFILFESQKYKIIAKNHQYLGVNSLMEAAARREALNGKLGVFWHTQGSGKSYSMVMFARKVKRKMVGNFTFLIITDREDLDTQIHKNFLRTEVIGPKDECQPKDSKQLRKFLTKDKEFIFTLIHKFRYDKTKSYPVLTTRNDIFVLVDEAHRTQYKDLAENMRAALPNANFVAFTGTPLLGSKRLTNQWFGNYVSEYNFAQSVEDGSTVPLFYSRRVPTVELENDYLDDDVVDIIEKENLNEDEAKLLENSSSRILEVIKRDDRLDKIARDIAHHFPRRGFLGKGMVVSVDKYTAVTMYNKVQHYWAEEKKAIMAERNTAKTKEERDKLTAILEYMNEVEMAVVISKEDGEEEKFAAKGLDISIHRKKMEEITVEGKDIEDRYKATDDKLHLVFVCAMWLTGFDVKNLSTLYLDKPMKSHTLMQAIARANRVYPGKPCGIIVDYVNVFMHMQKALADYAVPDDDTQMPAKDVDALIGYLDDCIGEGDAFLQSIGVSLDDIIGESSTFDQLDALREAYNVIVSNDNYKEKFKVLTNAMSNLHDASKPEIFERHWENSKYLPLAYLHGLMVNRIDDEKIRRAKQRMADVLDTSVVAAKAEDVLKEYAIHGTKVIDLSKIDAAELRKEIKRAEYKAIEIDDLKAFLEKTLQDMLSRNCTRDKFSNRFRNIIDRYNAGGTENEDYYEQLIKLLEDLQREQQRPNLEGLTEEELEMYDLLIKGRKLTKDEEQRVKLAAKSLYKKLTEEKEQLLVVDWYKDEQPKSRVKSAMEYTLNEFLPESYDKEAFDAKINLLLNHFIDMAIQGYGWVAA